MKKLTIAIALFSAAFAAQAATSEKEMQCIKETVQLKEALEKGTDSALNGFINLIPEYKQQLEKQVADPYRCSLADYDRK